MFFTTAPVWWLGGLLFIVANLAFGAAIVFYNSYLPDIASEDQRDRVSSFGWAMGYLGDGLLLLLNLAFYLVQRQAGRPPGPGGAHQPGLGRGLVVELLLLHLGAPAPPPCRQAAAEGRDLCPGGLQAVVEHAQGDEEFP